MSLSPRRRRLRLTLGLLGALLALGLACGVWMYWASRPSRYVPGEQSGDVTSALSQNLPPEAPQPRVADVSAPSGLAGFRNFAGDRSSQLPEDMGPGLAWGDYDNDGDDDLFLVSAGGTLGLATEALAPCQLFENQGDGTFRRATDLPDLRLHGMGAAWGDYTGDGFLDLAISGYNALILLRNEAREGRRVLERDERFPSRDGFWSSVSWGDFDNDRDLDLYVCNYVQYVPSAEDRQRTSDQLGVFVPYTLNPASYPPGLNRLFRNGGQGTFAEVAEALGVTNPTGRSLGALWHDFDDDGWLDLYVANDVSDNALYHNRRGEFQDISHPAWVADYRSAMGLTAGDYDRDGDDDLFITHWVAQENALYGNLWADSDRNATGPSASSGHAGVAPTAPAEGATNRLRFVDVNELRGLGQIALPFVGWGTEFVDLDGDGWLDLLVANGNTIEETGPPPKRLKPQEPFLFWNRRGEFFHDLAPFHPDLTRKHVSRGLAVSDYDLDGDMDFALTHLGEGVQLFRNDMQKGHWLKVRLRSRGPDGRVSGVGDGTKVIVHAAGVALRRTVSSVSYLSQSSRVLHFGLGAALMADRVEVRWLGGETNVFLQLAVDTMWELTEGEAEPRAIANPRVASAAPAGQAVAATAVATGSVPPGSAPAGSSERARLVEFWNHQRAAMNALKVDQDPAKAIPLFRAALALNPRHEDSRYYLGQCLFQVGDAAGALAEIEELTRINPQSHRGFQQWGVLRAVSARSMEDLGAAQKSLEQAHALNPEETGALLALGEVLLLRGDWVHAEERLRAACASNPRAAGGFFLRAYVASKNAQPADSVELLKSARQALGPDWQPRGATSEGDVRKKQHAETTPLARFWAEWNGQPDPTTAFNTLEVFLANPYSR